MIRRLILLPGMHGTGSLFSEFMSKVPPGIHIEALCYPIDVCPSYSQLLRMVESFVPASENYVLLGESFSTPLAIEFAATNPPNLKGLILCSGFASSPIRGWRKLFVALIAPIVFRLSLSKTAVVHFLVGKNASESLHAAVRAAIRSVKPGVLSARLSQVLAVDARPALTEISVPILFIQAQQDRLVGQSPLEEIREIIPQIKVVQIGGPHLILQREPQQCAKVVAAFMDRPSPDRS